jgi:hypothetical protein
VSSPPPANVQWNGRSLVTQHAVDNIGKKNLIMPGVVPGIAAEAMVDEFLNHFVGRIAGHFELIERLQRGKPRGASLLMRRTHRWSV